MTSSDQMTLAALPFLIRQRHPRPGLINRCEGDTVRAYSAREYYEQIRDFSLGLAGLGVENGDRVAVISESRPEWGIADLATLSAGAVTVPVYPTQAPDQVRFILDEAAVKVAVVSTPVQVEKVRAVARDLSSLRGIVVMEGTASADGIPVVTLDEACARGRALVDADPACESRYEARASAITPDSLATIVYTSGTTGEPKGVMLTHRNIMSNVQASILILAASPADTALSFLPLSHVFERLVFYRYLVDGVKVVFAESLATVARDLAAVKPTIMTGVPRVFEKFHTAIQEKVAQATGVQKHLLHWALGVGRVRSQAMLAGRHAPLAIRLQHAVADRLVFRKIRARVGGRIRFLISGSAPLSKAVAEFFHAIGLLIIEGYGLTETSPILTGNPPDAPRFGTVGKALPGVEIRIAPDGEILARGPNVMQGYYKRPEATREAFVDGWFRTGDIGELSDDGYLTITDRKKDLIVTSGGKKIAPQPLENLLKASPLISEVVLVGEGRKFPAALIVPDFAALETRARDLGWPVEPRDALVRRPEVIAMYQALVDEVNVHLAQFERIKRFHLLPTEFTMERGELTPTMKVRRKVVENTWREAIEQMYAAPAGAPQAAVPDVGV